MAAERATLLFLDDEERILRSLKMMFKHDYDVLTTTDPHRALEMVDSSDVDVVVSDQRMPEMEGVDVLRQIRDRSPSTMRVLLTGYSDMDAMVRSVNEGEIFRYIEKPWHPEKLKQTVADAVRAGASMDTVDQGELSAEAAGLDGPDVLVLDDDAETGQLVRELLAGATRVHETDTVEDAFALLADEDIGVLVADVSLSGEDISDAIKELKAAAPNIQTIVATSFQDRQSLHALINEGRIGRYLPKPLPRQLLSRALFSVLERARSMRARPELMAAERPERAEGAERPIRHRIFGYLQRLRGVRPGRG